MSRCCEVTINIRGHDIDRSEKIIDALIDLGYEAYNDTMGDRLPIDSEVINIPSMCSDESVAREIVEAVWKANKAFCKVDVGIRDLDAIPNFWWDEASFDKWHSTAK